MEASLCIGREPVMYSGPVNCRSGNKEWRVLVVMLSSPCPPPLLSLTGVNSFMVYMAYKDLYQVSNTEVMTHCCVA